MMQKRRYVTIFFFISLIAAVFVLTEVVLKSFGKSICVYEGCKMTAQYARFGDISIFLIGFFTFSSLAGLVFLNRSLQKPVVERFINLILVAALASEGFFMGYLAFRIHTICLICVSIFCFIFLLAILRLLAGEREVLAGLAALGAVFLLQYLVLPAGISVRVPEDRVVLFYSKDCKHCAEVIKELEGKKIQARHLEVMGYASYLQSMGIDSVPTLLVNDKYQKLYLTGRDAIMQYLLSCTTSQGAANKSPQKTKAGQTRASPGRQDVTIDIFNPSPWTSPGATAGEEGMCKQDEICK